MYKCPRCKSTNIWQEKCIDGNIGCNDCGYTSKNYQEWMLKIEKNQKELFESWKQLSTMFSNLSNAIQNPLDTASIEEVQEVRNGFGDAIRDFDEQYDRLIIEIITYFNNLLEQKSEDD